MSSIGKQQKDNKHPELTLPHHTTTPAASAVIIATPEAFGHHASITIACAHVHCHTTTTVDRTCVPHMCSTPTDRRYRESDLQDVPVIGISTQERVQNCELVETAMVSKWPVLQPLGCACLVVVSCRLCNGARGAPGRRHGTKDSIRQLPPTHSHTHSHIWQVSVDTQHGNDADGMNSRSVVYPENR
jgi:hypothetical protein